MEKRILFAATVFVLALTGAIAISVRLFGIGLPTCLTDVRPFSVGRVIEQGPKRYEIHYVARMWRFEPAEISIVPGSTADIYLSTADVTHGLEIVGTNVNLMAVPGTVNFARAKFDKPGDYVVVCNEYCGAAHHNMAAKIHVTTAAAAPPLVSPTLSGAQLVEKYGCVACHSLDGSQSVGPTLKGLYRSHVTLTNGMMITADDAYLRESIENPNAKVVKGYDAIMPPTPMTPAEVHAIVEYLETLR